MCIWFKIALDSGKNMCMVAERYLVSVCLRVTFSFSPSQLLARMMADAEGMCRSPMVDVDAEMSWVPAGGALMLKALAMGAVIIFELALATWRCYRRQCQREREQQQQQRQQQQQSEDNLALVVQRGSPGRTSAVSNLFSLAFNCEQLEVQEQVQQSSPQLLRDLRELRAQLRAQQQTYKE